MASVGPKYAGTGATSSQGGSPTPVAWTNPTNAQGDTTTTAATAAPGASGTPTQRLRLSNFGFTSGEVPDGNTITGIQIEVERTASSTNRGGWQTVQVLKTGAEHSDVGASTANWNTTKTIDSFGGDGDLLGATLTPADVRATGFGVSCIFIRNGNAVTGSVFRARITVFHAAPNVDATISVSGGGSVTIAATAEEASSEEHTGSLSVSGGGGIATTATKATASILTASGGGSASLAAFRNAVAALIASGGGSTAAVATTDRASALAVTSGGSITIAASTGEEPEAHSGAFSVSGGGSVTLAADTARLAPLAASGGGSATFTVTLDRGGGVAITGGGPVTVGSDTQRADALTVAGGGSVTLAHSASWGDVKSATLSISGGGGAALAITPDHQQALVVSGGGAVTITGSASQPAPALETTLTVSGGGGVRITTNLLSVDDRGIRIIIAPLDIIVARIVPGRLVASISPTEPIEGEIV